MTNMGSIFDQSWAQINKPRPWKLMRLKLWLYWLKFARATHIGCNRVYELELDKKICKLKVMVLNLTKASETHGTH